MARTHDENGNIVKSSDLVTITLDHKRNTLRFDNDDDEMVSIAANRLTHNQFKGYIYKCSGMTIFKDLDKTINEAASCVKDAYECSGFKVNIV